MKSKIYGIYQEEIENISYQPRSFFDAVIHRIKRNKNLNYHLEYIFVVPVSDYLRAELFCEDVSDAMEGTFSQKDLISILLDDFLYQAKKKSNPKDLYYELDSRSQNALEIRDYKGVTSTIKKTKKETSKKIFCYVKRKEALRLEVMLSDIVDLGYSDPFTVEDVLRIIYRDFIQNYKTGKLENILENVIRRQKAKTQ